MRITLDMFDSFPLCNGNIQIAGAPANGSNPPPPPAALPPGQHKMGRQVFIVERLAGCADSVVGKEGEAMERMGGPMVAVYL